MAWLNLCAVRGLLRIRPRPGDHRLAAGVDARTRRGSVPAVRSGPDLCRSPTATAGRCRTARQPARAVVDPVWGGRAAAGGRLGPLVVAAEPADRADARGVFAWPPGYLH